MQIHRQNLVVVSMGGHGVLGNEPESIDYSVHEAWNEATNVYLLVILVSFGLLINKRKIMRIFALPPTAGSSPEPNFYDSLQKVRLRQQLEMYSLARKFEQQQQQSQTESVQLSME
uniref:Small integral membrane protein 19 n=1 Tax=Amphiprion ocellaris TaxID=80972 RepID=A0AAQ5ZVW4_AMPOC